MPSHGRREEPCLAAASPLWPSPLARAVTQQTVLPSLGHQLCPHPFWVRAGLGGKGAVAPLWACQVIGSESLASNRAAEL